MSEIAQVRLTHCRNGALLVGLMGLAACVVGAVSNTRQFFVSYLFGYLFWLGLAVGCLTIAMLHYLTGGRWGYPIRRFLEAGFATLPLLALLFVPIFFGLQELYPWARADELVREEVLRKRLPYMNAPWFITRTVLVLLAWTAVAWLLRRWSLAQDETQDADLSRKLRKLSGIGVLLFPLTATFAYVDWIMSLEVEWYSTIFAIIVLSAQVLSAFAFTTILLRVFQEEQSLAEPASKLIYHQLGNLLLTFVLFWTYVSFGQLLIVYSANLPQEIQWYLHRIAGSWKIVAVLLAGLHFFLPFFLLLFRLMKKNPRYLVTIAAMLLLVHVMAVYWLVAPTFHPTGVKISWLDVAAPAGVGGVWLAMFLWLLARAPLMPRNDPRMEEELVYGTR